MRTVILGVRDFFLKVFGFQVNRVTKKLTYAIDVLKVKLYVLFKEEFSTRYEKVGVDVYSKWASSIVNEIFLNHNSFTQEVFDANEMFLEEEMQKMLKIRPDIKLIITDAIRIHSVLNLKIVKDSMHNEENWRELFF